MPDDSDHYATLKLDRRCTTAQVRTAYRLLARRHHPDRHAGSTESVTRTQELNAAYEILSDPARRRAYDDELEISREPLPSTRPGKVERNISHDAHLRIEDLIRGASLEVRIDDPANSDGVETYQLVVPPETAAGARIRLPRTGSFEGGYIDVRIRVFPGFRFKVRGSNLTCDLRIDSRRASLGGTEMIAGVSGAMIRIEVPAQISRGQIIRVPNEGMPKARGGRGDLLVRVTYRPEVRITRSRAN